MKIKPIFVILFFLAFFLWIKPSATAQNIVVEEFGVEERDSTNGTYKRYYPNGQLHIEGTFVDGKLHGVLRTYTEWGAKRLEARFREGVAVGKSVAYAYYPGTEILYQKLEGDLRVEARDHKTSMTIVAAVNRNTGQCVITNYDKNGELETIAHAEYVNYHGSYKIYSPDGVLIETKEVYIDKKNGLQVFYIYSPEGILIEEKHILYRNGKKVKEW